MPVGFSYGVVGLVVFLQIALDGLCTVVSVSPLRVSVRVCMHACVCVCVSVSVFEIYSCPSSLHVSENTSKQACIHTHLNARTYTHARTHAHEI